jgi:hypothetical protein
MLTLHRRSDLLVFGSIHDTYRVWRLQIPTFVDMGLMTSWMVDVAYCRDAHTYFACGAVHLVSESFDVVHRVDDEYRRLGEVPDDS